MPHIIRSENPLYPKVKITDALLDATGGQIKVDLDGINELLRTELGLDEEVAPKFTLYGRRDTSTILGFHFPFSRTACVNVQASEHFKSASSTLIHESVHLVDSIHHPIRTAGEVALRWGSHKGSMFAGSFVSGVLPGPVVTDAISHALTYYNLRMGLYYRHLDPSENRARAMENDHDVVEKYKDVIQVGRHATRFTMF